MDKVKIKELEDKILELRLDKIKEFSEYYETKQELELVSSSEIPPIKKIERLESKLKELQKVKETLEDAEKVATVWKENPDLSMGNLKYNDFDAIYAAANQVIKDSLGREAESLQEAPRSRSRRAPGTSGLCHLRDKP